ncbi:ABC transporter transmembrane domain-containing protein [Dongshaea marina]|uniref:ABC transporter transmembrane domain-containing protein n=1 Tax=Dongshaea marina TaxID=2047966 RepID=UPI000D3E4902|nr:ABC transporter transmembrane domain-containing protein [Dongshaea marina]
MKVFCRLAWFFKRYWRRYLAAVSLLFLVALLNLIPPWIVGRVVDRFLHQGLSGAQFLLFIGSLLLIGLAVYALRYLWRVLLFGASYRLSFLLRNQLYQHFLAMDRGFFRKHNTGELMAHATNDVQAVEMVAAQGILTLVDSLVMGSMVLVVMASGYSWQLTILSLLPLPVMAYLTRRLGQQIYCGFHESQHVFSELNNKVQESLSGIRVLKSFAVESLEQESFSRLTRQAMAANMRVARLDARFGPVIHLCVAFSYLFAVAGGGYLIVDKQMTLGELTSFTLYLGQLIWPMFALAWLFNLLERGNASSERIERLLAEHSRVAEPKSPREFASHFPLEARGLGYHYGSDEFSLSGIDFSLQPGQMLGLVGRTGAGKSSLLQLLMRLDDPSRGQILLGGVPLSQLPLAQVRTQFACVPQQAFLFSMTIAENIAIGKSGATQEEIEWAARIACVDQDICRLEHGYQTQVGERGVTLSGGQKQRIAIARALLLDAPYLILDDALSAVDARTEHLILNHLLNACQDRALIIASHRMSAVELASEILVLERGAITERGTHQQLMMNLGWYARMVRFQRIEQDLEA